jgi:hypothetical protein
MLKITTNGGTYYLIDEQFRSACRFKGEGRNEMRGDGEWFYYSSMGAWDSEEKRIVSPPVIGMPVFFNLTGHRDYDWRMTSTIRNIEEVE